MRKIRAKYSLPVAVFILVLGLLAVVQWKVAKPMLLLERFFPGWGWLQILFMAIYGAFIAIKMQDPSSALKWRRITWSLFSFVFFSQLILGLSGFDKFLMTGKLHLPIPMMIIGGPVYREQLSVMTFLFISTVVLTGPAWCSQFCYFGAFDHMIARGKISPKSIKNKWAIKSTLLFLVIFASLLLQWLSIHLFWATILALLFGLIGIGIMIFISRRKGKMYHCVMYCPIGSIINISKFANPFRLKIDTSCTLCMKCVSVCKYDALHLSDLKKQKPGIGCTLCGDCLSACKHDAIHYKYFRLSPNSSRMLYLLLTISIHTIFLALARI